MFWTSLNNFNTFLSVRETWTSTLSIILLLKIRVDCCKFGRLCNSITRTAKPCPPSAVNRSISHYYRLYRRGYELFFFLCCFVSFKCNTCSILCMVYIKIPCIISCMCGNLKHISWSLFLCKPFLNITVHCPSYCFTICVHCSQQGVISHTGCDWTQIMPCKVWKILL